MLKLDDTPPVSVPGHRLHRALRSHDFAHVEVDAVPNAGLVTVRMDVADANRLATILDEAAAR